MLAIIPLSSISVTSRGDPSAWSQASVSRRRPLRISVHSAASTWETVHASSHFASANGSPPSFAQRFINDSP